MPNPITIKSLQTGSIQTITATGTGEWWDKEWTTGFIKDDYRDSAWMGYQGLKGDGQADTKHHGGVDKAVCVYPFEHYSHWENLLGHQLPLGAFGENITLQGLVEDDIYIGDRYEIGEALIEITQPRQPCWKVARRWKHKTLTKLFQDSGKTGFYIRVLRHGEIKKSDTWHLVESHTEKWSITACNQAMYGASEPEIYRKLSTLAPLAGSWKDSFHQKYTASRPNT